MTEERYGYRNRTHLKIDIIVNTSVIVTEITTNNPPTPRTYCSSFESANSKPASFKGTFIMPALSLTEVAPSYAAKSSFRPLVLSIA